MLALWQQRGAVFAKRYGLSLTCFCAALFCSYGLMLELGTIDSFSGMYAGNAPYYNLQASALAKCELDLGRDSHLLKFDLVWINARVHQVWGLWIPAWIRTLSLITGNQDPLHFPSRLAFCVALCLVTWSILYYTATNTKKGLQGCNILDWRYWTVFVPTVTILLFFPSFTATLKSCFGVYEEASAYSYLYALLLLIVLLRFCDRSTQVRFVLLCMVAGMGAFVRPTVGFYGLAAIAVASVLAFHTGLKYSKVALGWIVFLSIIVLLLWTNSIRFGSAFEFGHGLNVSYHAGNIYSTKFDAPFANSEVFSAGQELIGSLFFDGNFNEGRWFNNDVFCLQSKTPRWRDNYLPAIGWPMIVIALLAGVISSLIARGDDTHHKYLVYASMAFSVVSIVGLTLFYLRCPLMTSRYLYDFSGALAVAGAIGMWRLLIWAVKRGQSYGLIAVLASTCMCLYLCHRAQTALCSEVSLVSCKKDVYELLLQRMLSGSTRLPGNSTNYGNVELVSGRLEGLLGIPFEGCGWLHNNGGQVRVATIHFVDNMQFLELDVTPAAYENTSSPETKHIRVKVGLEYLVQQSVRPVSGNRLRIRFHGPVNPDYGKGIQTIFVAWVSKEHISDEMAPWKLHKIRWRIHDSQMVKTTDY